MTIICDRWYTCTGLVQLCISLSVGLIGSTMAKRFLAKHVLVRWSGNDGANRPRGEFEVATNRDRSVGCCCWKDKGVVKLTMTSSHTARCTVVRRQRGMRSFLVRCPFAVLIFDMYFHGVDRNDQLRGIGYGISLTFRAQKWTIKLFMGLLDMICSNAWIIWRCLHPRRAKEHRAWFRRLAAEMLVFNPNGDPVYTPQPSRKSREAKAKEQAEHKLARFALVEGRAQRPLGMCPICSVGDSKKRSVYGCRKCLVPLHKGACFAKWHAMSVEERAAKRSRRRKMAFEPL